MVESSFTTSASNEYTQWEVKTPVWEQNITHVPKYVQGFIQGAVDSGEIDPSVLTQSVADAIHGRIDVGIHEAAHKGAAETVGTVHDITIVEQGNIGGSVTWSASASSVSEIEWKKVYVAEASHVGEEIFDINHRGRGMDKFQSNVAASNLSVLEGGSRSGHIESARSSLKWNPKLSRSYLLSEAESLVRRQIFPRLLPFAPRVLQFRQQQRPMPQIVVPSVENQDEKMADVIQFPQRNSINPQQLNQEVELAA